MPFDLPQKITYWLPTGNNGTGGKTWSAGVAVAARIASVSELFYDEEGRQQMANRAIYARVNVPLGGYVVEADHDGVASPENLDSRIVRKSSSNPSITDMNRMLL